MLRSQLRITLLLFIAFASTAYADTWTTEDGVLTVAVPDPERFEEVVSQERLSIAWASTTGRTLLLVEEVRDPSGATINRSLLEERFIEEFDGELIDSSIKRQANCEILSMTGRGSRNGSVVYSTLTMFVLENKRYKITAIGSENTLTDEDVVAFMDSIQIHVAEPSQDSAPLDASSFDIHDLSLGISCISSIILVVYHYITASNRNSKRRPNEPRSR